MITIPAQVESIMTRKDKTLKLTIGTNELNPKQIADLININQQFCYVALKPELFNNEELEAIDNLKTDLTTQKTPSQRLRAVMYLNFLSDDQGHKTFSNYYSEKMEQIIDKLKANLN